MKRAAAALLLAACWLPRPAAAETLDHGRFDGLRLLRPEGAARSTALLLSDSRGWDAQAQALAAALQRQQALVVGIDGAALAREFAGDGECSYLAGDLDNLGHFVQAYTRQDDYRAPLLVGVGDGAALAFGVLAQAPAASFGGGIALGFCPQSALQPPLCDGAGLRQQHSAGHSRFLAASRLHAPFTAIGGGAVEACGGGAFLRGIPGVRLQPPQPRRASAPSATAAALQAYAAMAQPQAAARPALALPLIELPATGQGRHPDLFAVLLSGDGGWAGLDRELAAQLARSGIPVVGFDSLRYFWTARTPEGLSADVERLIAHYRAAWRRPRVLLIGYSQGADVLPFVLNRLGAPARDALALAAPLALSARAAFEFHLGNWLTDAGEYDTRPEVAKLARSPKLLLVCGADDEDALCAQLNPRDYRIVQLPGSHHFDGDYARLAQTLLDGLEEP